MSFLKNRTVIGIICIALSLIICFALTPLFNAGMSKKVTILRVAKDIKAGEEITKNMIKSVEVGSYNLPENVFKDTLQVVGKYAKADMLVDDYILVGKITDEPASENLYLYNLDGKKQAISVTLKNFAGGLSGKLISGDIVSVIAPDYQKKGITVIPEELKYVEVIAVTSKKGNDTDVDTAVKSKSKEEDSKELPSTVTLLVSPEQSKILAELESTGKLHLSLVYRGTKQNTQKFIKIQDEIIEELYPVVEEDEANQQTDEQINQQKEKSVQSQTEVDSANTKVDAQINVQTEEESNPENTEESTSPVEQQ